MQRTRRVGGNAHFIIAESIGADGQPDHWIIERERDEPLLNADETVLGPMDSAVFAERLVALSAGDIGFTAQFSE